MKKLLAILGACVMTSSAAGTVVACDDGKTNDVISIKSAKFVSKTGIDVFMNKRMTAPDLMAKDFVITVNDAFSGNENYMIKSAALDGIDRKVVHLILLADYSSKKNLQISFKRGNRVKIEPLVVVPATALSAAFVGDTKINIMMNQAVKQTDFKLSDFVISVKPKLVSTVVYEIQSAKVDSINVALIHVTIAAGHCFETNLQLSYKDGDKINIAAMEAPAVAVSAKFSGDGIIDVTMDKDVVASDITADDFIITAKSGLLVADDYKVKSAVIDDLDRGLVHLSIELGHALQTNLQLSYKAAAKIAIMPLKIVPAIAQTAVFVNDSTIDVKMDKKVVASDFSLNDFSITSGTQRNYGILSAKVDEMDAKVIHLVIEKGHSSETNLMLSYKKAKSIEISAIKKPTVLAASMESIDTEHKTDLINLKMNTIIEKPDAAKFIVSAASKSSIADSNYVVSAAVLDSADLSVIQLVVVWDKQQKPLQVSYDQSKPIIVSDFQSHPIKMAQFFIKQQESYNLF